MSEYATIEDVLAEYPEAAPFADLIAAGSVTEFAGVAQEIAKKVRNVQDNPTQGEPVRRKEPALTVEQAITNRSWSDYLNAKWEQTQAERSND
jgi:hypothetical protein